MYNKHNSKTVYEWIVLVTTMTYIGNVDSSPISIIPLIKQKSINNTD